MNSLIVEDEELVRELLASILIKEFESKRVDEAGDGEAGWEQFQETDYDFVVLDLMLPKLDGLSLARRMLEAKPKTRILVLSSECDDYTIRVVHDCGILGFVHKPEMSLEVLFEAFNEVSAGYTFYSVNAQEKLTKMWGDPDAYYKLLSDREFQVVRMVAQGASYDAIGEKLGISAFTVRRHKHNAMQKLNVSDDASLLRFALEKGIVKSKGGLDWTTVSHRKQ
ncbi:MAG: response regulator [Coraliomargarita sp.]